MAAGLGPLDPLVETFGPFLFPVVLFVAGVVGYLVLVALGRTGLIDAENHTAASGRHAAAEADGAGEAEAGGRTDDGDGPARPDDRG